MRVEQVGCLEGPEVARPPYVNSGAAVQDIPFQLHDNANSEPKKDTPEKTRKTCCPLVMKEDGASVKKEDVPRHVNAE